MPKVYRKTQSLPWRNSESGEDLTREADNSVEFMRGSPDLLVKNMIRKCFRATCLLNDLGKFLIYLCLGFCHHLPHRLILRMKCGAWCLIGTQQCWSPPPPPSREKHDWKSLGREAAGEKGKKVAWLERAANNSRLFGDTIIFHGSISIKIVLSVSLKLKISRTSNNSCGVLVFLLWLCVFFFCQRWAERTLSSSHCYW